MKIINMTREELIDFSYYIVKEDGEIYSKCIKKNMKNSVNENGYVRNNFKCKDGVQRPYYRERVIYFFFNGVIDENLVIDHINGDKLDNSKNNLRCITQEDNVHNEITFAKWEKVNKAPKHNTPHTEESKRKISEAKKGRKLPEEQIKRMSICFKGEGNPFYGKHHTEETILKRSTEVFVFDKYFNFIKRYISINKCEEDGYSHIKEKMEHKRKDPNGLIFMSRDEYEEFINKEKMLGEFEAP